MSNANKPAFTYLERDPWNRVTLTGGLTKRELFAAIAMQGMCAGPAMDNVVKFTRGSNTLAESVIAKMAVTQADALLATLEETK